MGFRGRGRQSRSVPQHQTPVTQPPAAGLISAIEPQERRGGKRCNVYLDGRYAFSLTTELAVMEQLRVGEALSAERYSELVV